MWGRLTLGSCYNSDLLLPVSSFPPISGSMKQFLDPKTEKGFHSWLAVVYAPLRNGAQESQATNQMLFLTPSFLDWPKTGTFVILPCLTPDDFTCQRKASRVNGLIKTRLVFNCLCVSCHVIKEMVSWDSTKISRIDLLCNFCALPTSCVHW